MKIKALKTFTHINLGNLDEGRVYPDVDDKIGQSLVKQELAEEVKEESPESQEPTTPTE